MRILLKQRSYSFGQLFGDLWAPYTLAKLVDDANASKFIEALDGAEDEKKEQEVHVHVARRRASWFNKQNFQVDMGRTMTREWDAEKRAWGKWHEL